MKNKKKFSIYLRALRLPFISVSVLPFIFGSVLVVNEFSFFFFFLGLTAVIFSHLSANLLNDYADSKSGADWIDTTFYGFFGGSKLIQRGDFSQEWYLRGSLLLGGIALLSVLILSIFMKSIFVLVVYILILGLYFSYSHPPFKFSYHRLGELVIFILFGPALVMGGYFIQTAVFPDVKSFLLSVPFGLLTTLILFCNQVPDYQADRKAGKYNWVDFFGKDKAYIGYYILTVLAGSIILVNFFLEYLDKLALLSLLFLFLCVRAGWVIKEYNESKQRLLESSKLTILAHFLVSLVLIADILVRR